MYVNLEDINIKCCYDQKSIVGRDTDAIFIRSRTPSLP